jgi:nitric oxide reductase activation protein
MAESRAERKRKVLIVVSDGSPNGRGYGGEEAEEHVALCKKDVKARFGIDTYAIGISNAYSQHEGDKMYGAGNNIIIGDVKSSVGFLSRFLNQVSQIA